MYFCWVRFWVFKSINMVMLMHRMHVACVGMHYSTAYFFHWLLLYYIDCECAVSLTMKVYACLLAQSTQHVYWSQKVLSTRVVVHLTGCFLTGDSLHTRLGTWWVEAE